ncbi:MAG: Glutamate-tRNA ligase [Candidatus Peregrinibacteria bacterium GW2011_GWA2_38_36]|nr:MAG: Glutamate-tRNA ligase [Candidatus Peregrinibacteria bacterium GW2011_GWA2_38_36]
MIRTRFAPSPTGFLHVGSLRTALYSYLFAKKNNGQFILRIEDTDRNRIVENAVENLLTTLKWAEIEYDEGPVKNGKFGPYIQSERFDIYKKYADELLKNSHAYKCFCTAERLDEMRKTQETAHLAPMYDKKCLNLSPAEIEKNIADGIPFVIRQNVDHSRTIKIEDLIRGNVYFDCKTVDDQVLVKSDGFPTYHLANVVDDHLMEISHVIRGEEWLPSTPKHVLLYEAFGWTAPLFAHIPLLLNADKTKLSKRQGDVSVEDYINKGYLKEAVINFIAFLGWNPGKGVTKEIYSIEELIQEFSLEHVHKAGAVFNLEKLDWYNWQWRKKMHIEKVEKTPDLRGKLLLEIAEKYINPEWKKDEKFLERAIVTIEEKILQNPAETEKLISFYFSEQKFDAALITNEKMKVTLEIAKKVLSEAKTTLENLQDFSLESIKTSLMEMIKKLELSNGQVLWPIRAAITGEQFSPGAFEIIWAFGKDTSLARLTNAINKL